MSRNEGVKNGAKKKEQKFMPEAFQTICLIKKSVLISVNLCRSKKTQNKPIFKKPKLL